MKPRASTNFFMEVKKGEKRGGGVGHFCQNYPEITCFLRVRDGFRVTTRETFGNPTSLERRINLSSQIYSSSSSRVTQLFIDYFFLIDIDSFFSTDISNEYNNFSTKREEEMKKVYIYIIRFNGRIKSTSLSNKRIVIFFIRENCRLLEIKILIFEEINCKVKKKRKEGEISISRKLQET